MRRKIGITLAILAAAAAAGCGDTLQDQPVAPQSLESVIVKSRFPVYWLGLRFQGMGVSGVNIDPGGAVTIYYGDCLIGGQYTCVPPLMIVTSPDNSFVPGGQTGAARLPVRGVQAAAMSGGRTLAVATGGVVVSIYARTPPLAVDAAQTMVPLNKVGSPGQPLAKPLPDTGFDRVPLPSEVPPGASP